MFAHLIAHSTMGFSLIPLQPNTNLPATAWKPFQTTRASSDQLNQWFLQAIHGIGIVTGSISNLLVLDFDDPQKYRQFCQQFPDMAKSYTVKTRRGYHIYLRVPENSSIKSRKLDGIDVLFEGRYVVTPPTKVKGFTYRVVNNGSLDSNLHELNASQLAALQAYLFPDNAPDNRPASNKTPVGTDTLVCPLLPPTAIMDDHQIIATYHRRAKSIERNNALFQTACDLRDGGWQSHEVIDLLSEVHVQALNPNALGESIRSRAAEARHTIQSAFNRPRRTARDSHVASYVPNTIREYLLKAKLTGLLRTLEGLHLAGFRTGQAFTRQQAITVLSGIVGRDSIDNALHATLGDSPIFTPLEPPSNATAAKKGRSTKSKNGIFDGVTKSGKIVGRHKNAYLMPSIEQLYTLTGAKASGADPITLEDIQSAKAYRQAIHTKLIKRKPGHYSRQLLATRVGVSLTTIRRYDRACNIIAMPSYTKTPIFAHNLDSLIPPDHDPLHDKTHKLFLEDRFGRRYPLKREIAIIHIKHNKQLLFVEQEFNYYRVGESQPQAPAGYTLDIEFKEPPRPKRKQQPKRRWKTTSDETQPAATSTPDVQPVEKESFTSQQVLVQYQRQDDPKWRQDYEVIMATKYSATDTPEMQQYWGERLYTEVNQRAGESKQISLENAIALVKEHGSKFARKALYILQQRQNIASPAGFVITIMRSESKAKRKGWA